MSACAPDAFVARLADGTAPGELALFAAGTELNAQRIDLVGLSTHGLAFLPEA